MPSRSRRPASPVALDRVIHEPVRLALICAVAARKEGLTFKALKARLGATDGNLGLHARRLEAAGYVACTKSFDGRRPRSQYRLTARGRRALEAYRAEIRRVLETSG